MKKGLIILLLGVVNFVFAENEIPLDICPTLLMSGNDVSCYGDNDGSAFVQAINGSGNYTYNWSNGVNTTSNVGLTVGTYTVLVKDLTTGCTVVGAYVVGSPDPILTDEIVTNVLCNGDATGQVNVTTYGGTSPYNFSWTNGTTNEDLTNVQAGVYTLSISDQNNCTYSEAYTITEPLEPLQGDAVVNDADCFATTTGSIDLTAWGGSPAYGYLWSTGAVTQDISNLATGNYSVVITDNNGCTLNQSYFIDQPQALGGTMSSSDVLCFGESTGVASIAVTGGTTLYNYSWQNSVNLFAANSATLSGIPADNYQVTVTDGNGCVYIDNIDVFQPSEIQIASVISNVNCFGGSDGEINITVSGGSPAYSYSWTDDGGNVISTSQDLVNVPAGIYSVVVTDVNGCTKSITEEVTQPLLPITVTYSVVDVLCFGNNTGSIDLTVSGGTPLYSYSWSSGQSTEDVSNLLAGNYTYTVIDANGCIETDVVTVNQPAAPLTVTAVIQDVNCFGESNGSIDLTVTGGTAGYTFDWQNSAFNLSYSQEDLINFPADAYRYEVTDANGCQAIDTLDINEPDELIPVINPTHIACYGEATGEIDLVVTGGTTPYFYAWSNGPITEDQTNLIAGFYAVTVTDDHGCVANTDITLLQPTDTISFTADITPVTCNNGTDGAIDLFVSGGTPGYDYLWSTGDTLPSIDELTGGYFHFSVIDNNNCLFEDSIFVYQPDPLLLNEVVTPVRCYGGSDGSIELNPTGGTAPYTFAWFDSTFALAYQGEDLIDFVANVYQVEITDSNGCFYEEFIELPQPDSLIVDAEIKQVTCYGGDDGAVFIDISGGNPGYITNWSNGTTDEDLIDVVSDTFELVVIDTKQCTDTFSYFVWQPDSMGVVFSHDPVTCVDHSNGVAYAYPFGGNGGYSYDWNNGSIEDIAQNLHSDWHSLLVTDVLGCEVRDSVFVTKIDRPCIDPPNAFTPNGDNYNDGWQIDNIHLYPDLEVLVFNKWGNQVHRQAGGYEPWDGKINGVDAPSDTYYYVININYLDRKAVVGNVTILR